MKQECISGNVKIPRLVRRRLCAISDKLWQKELDDCTALKEGMTNDSFRVTISGKKYIIRLNGVGTEELINRENEKINYAVIAQHHIGDHVIDIDDADGYKVTEYMDNVHNCNPENEEEVRLCMEELKRFHAMHLRVPHEFDLFKKIDFYESLWRREKSSYADYSEVKQSVWRLIPYIEKNHGTWGMTHIDAVPDNFLITPGKDICLIDWEYAAMCDCYLDIAMFALYAGYGRRKLDQLMDFYFQGQTEYRIRVLIYCYMAVAGLLWSNWCEFKEDLGIQFGDYAKKQYEYAKSYSELVLNLIGESNCL